MMALGDLGGLLVDADAKRDLADVWQGEDVVHHKVSRPALAPCIKMVIGHAFLRLS